MNKADSERMLGLLAPLSYTETNNAADADLLILNTCTIREGAADRAYGRLHQWKKFKSAKPSTMIALAGCLAQEKGAEIQRKIPHIDLVFGTHNLHRLPVLLRQAKDTGEAQCEFFEALPEEIPETPVIRQTRVTAWVNVILGCNFNCTYCIVPQVRGREKSRQPSFIRSEIEKLIAEGYKEVTLLGQNVTAYGLDTGSSLAELLEYVHEIEGLERIRFLTGHPHHVTQELIETVARLPRVSKSFHIPMQAGDDQVLKRMARVYTAEKYLQMVKDIRTLMPDAHITSDFIVGFPGETHEQFLNTCRIVEKVKFASAITAMYSPRRNTPGGLWEQDPKLQVPAEEKRARIRHLNAVVTENVEKFAQEVYTHTPIQRVLIEGDNPQNSDMYFGRTDGGKLCYFHKDDRFSEGDTVSVLINGINPWSLQGEIVSERGEIVSE